jgi:hypothetical protein
LPTDCRRNYEKLESSLREGEWQGMAVLVTKIDTHEVELRLKDFESRFGLPSNRFIEAFQNGELDDSPEFFEWDMLYTAYVAATGAARP